MSYASGLSSCLQDVLPRYGERQKMPLIWRTKTRARDVYLKKILSQVFANKLQKEQLAKQIIEGKEYFRELQPCLESSVPTDCFLGPLHYNVGTYNLFLMNLYKYFKEYDLPATIQTFQDMPPRGTATNTSRHTKFIRIVV